MFFSNQAQNETIMSLMNYLSGEKIKEDYLGSYVWQLELLVHLILKFLNNEDIVTTKSISFHPDETHTPLMREGKT